MEVETYPMPHDEVRVNRMTQAAEDALTAAQTALSNSGMSNAQEDVIALAAGLLAWDGK